MQLPVALLAAFRTEGAILAGGRNPVGAVTVGADRRALVSLIQDGIMNALQRAGMFVKVAALAAVRGGDGVIPQGAKIALGMLLRGEAEMAVRAAEHVVLGRVEHRQVGTQHQGLATSEHRGDGMLMAPLAVTPFTLQDLPAGDGSYVMRAVAVGTRWGTTVLRVLQ
jgi:hypothetical protein